VISPASSAVLGQRHISRVFLKNGELCAGWIILRLKADLLEQRRATSVIEELGRDRFAGMAEALEHCFPEGFPVGSQIVKGDPLFHGMWCLATAELTRLRAFTRC
jgi:hypothetical protein